VSAFGYTSRDFDTIKQDMLDRATRVLPEWTDRDSSDFGMMLIDLWAFAADSMHFYMDRAAGESFLDTATQRESVQAFARLFDYTPQTRTSAQGTVTIRNDTTAGYTVERYAEFVARSDNRSYICYSRAAASIPPLSTVEVNAAQGEPILNETLTTASSGLPSQRYSLNVDGAVVSSIEVFVLEDGINPVRYFRTARMSTARASERVFEVDILSDGTVDIVFGDFINGLIPPTGSRIYVDYIVSEGSRGNIPANSVVGFRSSVGPNILVTSSSNFSGGIDDEGITSIKSNIPSAVASQERAVTRSDFVNLATSLTSVAKAAVSYEPAIVTGASATGGSVTIYAQPYLSDYVRSTETSQTVPNVIRQEVVEFIQPLAMLGVTVVAAPVVEWTSVDIEITVNVNAKAVTSSVQRSLQLGIENLFNFDNVFFGQLLVLAQIYRRCLDIIGVDYVTITKFCEAGGSSVESEILVDPLKLPKLGTLTLTMVGGISSGGT
jgi:hypothetical protein